MSLCKALEAKLGGAKSPPTPVPPPRSDQVSICVLPFANMSGDPEQDYFSDGITEDITTDLGKVSALSIVSRNLAFSFKGASGGVAEIGRKTNATHVLAGSVRKAGQRVRITAQLMDAAKDAQVWSERYDRELDDIFALQDEISKAIVSALKLTLLPEEKEALAQRATSNAEAYKLYLMARQFWLRDNERNNEIVVRICKHVVELDPNYAQAWATLGLAKWNLFWQTDLQQDDLAYPASRALALGPHLADSHAAQAAVKRSAGDFDGALAAAKQAVELEPTSYVANRLAGLSCMGLRRFDEAVGYFEAAAGLMESDFTAASFVAQCHEAMGDVEGTQLAAAKAMKRIEKIVSEDPGHGRAIGFGASLLVTLGQKERAKEWTKRARLIDPDNANLQYNLACAMSMLGEHDEAITILRGVAERSSPGMLGWIESDSDLDPIRTHPGYLEIIEGARLRLANMGEQQAA
jgi:adenylate cyclase